MAVGSIYRRTYSFNLACAVRAAVARIDGEFTYGEVFAAVRLEHPDFEESSARRARHKTCGGGLEAR